ncbi:RNA polymerase sigma-70 factor [Chitinophaga sp. 212800010-3]|uniref:RNA polymerase sigma-70 factor n=1 Tax=unclassified Chitinophaga TaxID=2619133 RepID=UPI002DEB4552|nr:RNA polymerase sigma-70 factor, ECF subfamily [Chitinophaga sp. 212800010-3]
MRADALYEQFRLVFEKFYNPLCRYANSFVKEPNICEDIVQEVFIRIWETRKDLIASDNVRFYLFTAVRNNCLTYLRREQKHVVYSLSDLDTEDEDVTDTAPWTGDPINYHALLGQAIAQLPPKCKEVFLLCRMGELSNQQAADSLGISVKTVNNQLWKALKLLKTFVSNAKCLLLFFL